MPAQQLVIECAHPVALAHTVSIHGWVGLSPWAWDGEAGVLSRRDRLPSGGAASIRVSQHSPRSFSVEVEPEDTNSAGREAVRGIVARWLSTDWDPEPAVEVAGPIDPKIARFIKDGGGRFLRGSTFYEDFAKTVCTIQIAWSGTKRMVAALIDEIGGGLFPTPGQVVDAGEAGLRERARLGFRAPQLLEATQTMLGRGLMDEHGRESEGRITYEELIGMRGIGPYAASHVMMLLHDFSRVPIDSEVTRHYGERHGLKPDEIEPFLDQWGDYRVLGHHLQRREGE